MAAETSWPTPAGFRRHTERNYVTVILCIDVHVLISIIFGRPVTEKVSNETMLYFSKPPITSASALRGEAENRQVA